MSADCRRIDFRMAKDIILSSFYLPIHLCMHSVLFIFPVLCSQFLPIHSFSPIILSFVFLFSFIRTRVTVLVNNEAQFLYVCCLVGPFLQRFQLERTRCLQEVTMNSSYKQPEN